MSTTLIQTEHQVSETLVNFLRQFDFADRLWARTDQGHIIFWLLTRPIAYQQEREVFRANGEIYRNVPGARFDFLVINPAAYEEWTAFEPPDGAREIPLH